MKKITIILGLVVSGLSLFAQSHVDALRYSQHIIGGTARYTSMSGAFGALGGDFSTLSHNPAGIAVYRSSEFTLTPEFYTDNTRTRYFRKEVDESKFNFNLNNIGYVSANKGSGSLSFINLGFGYNKLANFNKNYIINGDNPYSTYADYMAEDANNYGLWHFGSGMFWDGLVIDGNDADGYEVNPEYWINDTIIEQKITSKETGKINEFTFTVGLNFSDIFCFGTTLGIQPLKYSSERITREYDAAVRSDQLFEYREKLKVRGTGYTAKFGGILKPVPQLRLGAAFHLPVRYNLSETYTPTLETIWFSNTVFSPRDAGAGANILSNDYTVTTPSKVILSAAAVIGKFLIVSSDFEFIDYSKMRLHNDNDDFDNENELIQEIYTKTLNAKFGTELRFGGLYIRGGSAFYGSPFADDEINYDANRYSYSCGFGIRDDSFFFDISYVYSFYEERQIQYNVNVWGQNYSPAANLDTRTHRVLTTVGFRF